MNRDKMLTARQLVSKAFEELKPNGFKFKVMGGTYDCSKGTIRIEVYEVDETKPNERIEMKNTLNDRLDDEEFYNLMQAYRYTPMVDQDKTVERYEAVKKWIRENYTYKGTVVSGEIPRFCFVCGSRLEYTGLGWLQCCSEKCGEVFRVNNDEKGNHHMMLFRTPFTPKFKTTNYES